jgi:hypothetical protein
MSLLGKRLRDAREARGISPLQVEIDTRIRANVIQALEEGDYESLPPEPFLRGLIRSYSNYLGVNSQEMLDLYTADLAPIAPALPQPERPLIPKKPTPVTPPKASEPVKPPAPKPVPPVPAAPPAPTQSSAPAAPPPIETQLAQPAPPQPSAPTAPPPSTPPESLAPPEKLERAQPSDVAAVAAPVFLAHITRRGIPFPVALLIAAVILLACLAGIIVAAAKAGPAMISLAGARATATRIAGTSTPTLELGAPPTPVPTLALTAAPFATFPGNPTATPAAPPTRTPGTTTGLNLDVSATQTITLQVGIDGVLVFNGQMQPGDSRSWSAKDTLYVHVVNPRGATLRFNGNPKWFGALNFAERTELARMWTLNDKGVAVSVAPVAPAAAPTATPALALPSPLPNPSPTLTPFS